MHYKVGAVYQVNRFCVIAFPIKTIGNNPHLHKTWCWESSKEVDKALFWCLDYKRGAVRCAASRRGAYHRYYVVACRVEPIPPLFMRVCKPNKVGSKQHRRPPSKVICGRDGWANMKSDRTIKLNELLLNGLVGHKFVDVLLPYTQTVQIIQYP